MRRMRLTIVSLCALLGCGTSLLSDPDLVHDAPAEDHTHPPPPGQPDAGTPHADAVAPAVKSDLSYRVFGDVHAPPVVFLHGGPGATSYGFELTAAPEIAARGYYVVAYDQRGSGRSPK